MDDLAVLECLPKLGIMLRRAARTVPMSLDPAYDSVKSRTTTPSTPVPPRRSPSTRDFSTDADTTPHAVGMIVKRYEENTFFTWRWKSLEKDLI